MSNHFPCPACKGEGSWIEDYFEFGPGPSYNCVLCNGEGIIQIGSDLHWQIKRDKVKEVIWGKFALEGRDYSEEICVQVDSLISQIEELLKAEQLTPV